MTICITALSNHGYDIFAASDSKVAFGEFSADKAVQKHIPFIHHFAVLFAGNDVAHAGPVISRARKRLTDAIGQATTSSADEIAECIFEECQRERDRVSEAEILKPHGYDHAIFKAQGKDLCTDAVFYDIHAELQKRTFSLDFIVAGFDKKGSRSH